MCLGIYPEEVLWFTLTPVPTCSPRRLIVERVAAGWPPAHVAEQLGISRSTVSRLRRHTEGGDAALADRSSRPHRMPNRSSDRVEQKVLTARRRRKRGAVVLAAELGLNPSTVGRILARHQVPALSAIDLITGQELRCSRRSPNRYEHPTLGAMVHVDVKSWAHPGRRWLAASGRDAAVSAAHRHKKIKVGYDYVHTAIDDYTRLAYSEVLPDEKDPTCAGFLHRAMTWFATHGVRVRQLLTDNAMVYRRGTDWAQVCSDWQQHADSPNPAARGPTAKPNASTEPCSPNGLRPTLDEQQPAHTRP